MLHDLYRTLLIACPYGFDNLGVFIDGAIRRVISRIERHDQRAAYHDFRHISRKHLVARQLGQKDMEFARQPDGNRTVLALYVFFTANMGFEAFIAAFGHALAKQPDHLGFKAAAHLEDMFGLFPGRLGNTGATIAPRDDQTLVLKPHKCVSRDRPTHPELLDWLAVQFVDEGWSIKAMHRLIMLSSTYQMSTTYDAVAAEQDPENRLLWRRSRQRLDAESIRDSLLFVAGNLDFSMGGTLLPTENRKYVTSTANVNPVVYDTQRRSMYLPIVRSALYEVFQAFDFADPAVSSGERMSTTVAPQALFMMNSEIVSKQSLALAERLLSRDATDPARVVSLYKQTLSRPPMDEETESALAYVRQLTEMLKSKDIEESKASTTAWQSLCRAVLSSNEYLYVE